MNPKSDNHNRKIHSFDVFDTCLTRKMAVPTSIFYDVARKVFLKLGRPDNHPAREDFISARVQAESTARDLSGREDVRLIEIWQQLAQTMGWSAAESLAHCELDVEEALLAPIPHICEQVQAARQSGSRIIFVSDMYLPTEFIKNQLIKHGFAEVDDGFYVSGDVGKTKHTGNLFRHLLTQEKVLPAQVLHTGDNEHSDHAVPSKMGIHTRLFCEAKLTQVELSVLQNRQCPPSAARIVGAMRSFRLGRYEKDEQGINELASQFVAPFIMGYATWVLQQAQKDGVKRLYFMSRDAQLVGKVARELSPQFGGIDCRYLYVSRQALWLPSAEAISPEEMPWMRKLYPEPRLDRLLMILELDYSDLESSFRILTGDEHGGYQLKSAKDWEIFWGVLNTEPIKSTIMKLIAVRRLAAHNYLELAGLFDPVPWAVVDIGWTLKCQQSLWKLLRLAKWQGRISGYFAFLSQNRTIAGNNQALFYQSASDYPDNASAPFGSEQLIENVLGCADHPTLHHYDIINGLPCPIFGKSLERDTPEFCHKLHEYVLEFVTYNRTLTESFSGVEAGRDILQSLVTSFVRSPTKAVAASLKQLSVSLDDNMNTLPMVKPMSVGAALLPLLPKRRPFEGLWVARKRFWPEGSMAVTAPRVRRVDKYAQRLIRILAGVLSKLKLI